MTDGAIFGFVAANIAVGLLSAACGGDGHEDRTPVPPEDLSLTCFITEIASEAPSTHFGARIGFPQGSTP